MFGPLNGVRLALVIGALVAALISFIVGFPGAGLVLLVGVALHGFGWVYLYLKRQPDASEPQ